MRRVIGAILGVALAAGSVDAKICGLWINEQEFVPYSTCDYKRHPMARHKHPSHPPRLSRQPKHTRARHEHPSRLPRPRSEHRHHHEAHESIPTPKRRPDNLYEKIYKVLHPSGE